jgi:hypothetical protein
MRWEEPPDSGGFEKNKRSVYVTEAEELRSRPGEWGLVDTFPLAGLSPAEVKSRDAHARTVTNSINHGKYVAFRPEGSFNSVSRKGTDEHGNPVIKVYGRYLKEAAGDDETYR